MDRSTLTRSFPITPRWTARFARRPTVLLARASVGRSRRTDRLATDGGRPTPSAAAFESADDESPVEEHLARYLSQNQAR